jgi:hypothetical protein
MSGDVAREGCRKAELHGGCSMLAVEAMRVPGCCRRLVVGCCCSAHPLHTHGACPTDDTSLRAC